MRLETGLTAPGRSALAPAAFQRPQADAGVVL